MEQDKQQELDKALTDEEVAKLVGGEGVRKEDLFYCKCRKCGREAYSRLRMCRCTCGGVMICAD